MRKNVFVQELFECKISFQNRKKVYGHIKNRIKNKYQKSEYYEMYS